MNNCAFVIQFEKKTFFHKEVFSRSGGRRRLDFFLDTDDLFLCKKFWSMKMAIKKMNAIVEQCPGLKPVVRTVDMSNYPYQLV